MVNLATTSVGYFTGSPDGGDSDFFQVTSISVKTMLPFLGLLDLFESSRNLRSITAATESNWLSINFRDTRDERKLAGISLAVVVVWIIFIFVGADGNALVAVVVETLVFDCVASFGAIFSHCNEKVVMAALGNSGVIGSGSTAVRTDSVFAGIAAHLVVVHNGLAT